MENIKEKLLTKLQSGNLVPELMNLWNKVIANLDEARLSDILDFIDSTPNGLQILTSNMKSKFEALQKNDFSSWNDIFEKEKKIINLLGTK